MRKLLSFLLIFNLAHATAPTGYKNETATAKTYAQDLVFPNNQLTKQAGLDSRIETGNTNLLTNPSFEHSTVTTGWTITNATATADTTNQVEGKKALSLALTGALSVVQDSTINAANLIGLQGVARIKIKTSDVDGLKVCARNAGVTSTSLCINIPKDGVWKEINIPNILTATSNGIAITSTGTTGTVKLDDAFVGTSAPFQGVSGAKLVGTVTITGCTGAWSTTSTSFADFAAQTNCVYATTGQAIADTSFGNTQRPAIKFASLPAGDYQIQYDVKAYSGTSASDNYLQFWDGTNTAREFTDYITGTGGGGFSNASQSISYSTSQTNVGFYLRGRVSSGTLSLYGQTGQPMIIKVWYFPPESKIYSQASLDYDWTSYTPTFTGFGTTTNNECFHKREGSDLLVRCKFTSGTATATEARISLPNSLVVNPTVIPTIAVVGDLRRNIANGSWTYTMLAEPSVSYMTIGAADTARSSLTKYNGNDIFGNGNVLSLTARIPIQGWQDYGTIVGSFAGIEKCVNDYECVDSFSAKISSAGVVSSENIDWINGNCTGTATKTCTYVTILKDGVSALVNPMSCHVTSISGAAAPESQIESTNSSTQLIFTTYSSAGTGTATDVYVTCSKAGVDSKPKTAKVATSIGVPTVPGITTTGTGNLIDTFSVSYGTTNATTVCSASPCSYLDQIGNVVSSITRNSVGNYTMNVGKTYSKLKCTTAALGASAAVRPSTVGSCSSCSSLTFYSTNSTISGYEDTYGTLYCQGSY